MTEETRCSLAASDKGSYHREWPPEPSNYEESIGASRQNILRTEERGLLNDWTDFNRNSDSASPDDPNLSTEQIIALHAHGMALHKATK